MIVEKFRSVFFLFVEKNMKNSRDIMFDSVFEHNFCYPWQKGKALVWDEHDDKGLSSLLSISNKYGGLESFFFLLFVGKVD